MSWTITPRRLKSSNMGRDYWKLFKEMFRSEYPEYDGRVKKCDIEIPLIRVIDVIGFDVALSCLYAVEGHDGEMRLLAVKYARHVENLIKDDRSINALDVAEQFALGLATKEELNAANMYVASDVARATTRSYASSAALDTAWDAASVVKSREMVSTWDEAFDAALDARDAERKWQEQQFRAMIQGEV